MKHTLGFLKRLNYYQAGYGEKISLKIAGVTELILRLKNRKKS